MDRKSHVYPDGTEYKGQWQDGKRHGRGVCVRPDGVRYSGTWKNDTPDGYGELVYPDGSTLAGNWVRGKFAGAEQAPPFEDDQREQPENDDENRDPVIIPAGIKAAGPDEKAKKNRGKKAGVVQFHPGAKRSREPSEPEKPPKRRWLVPAAMLFTVLMAAVLVLFLTRDRGDDDLFRLLTQLLPGTVREVEVTVPAELAADSDIQEKIAAIMEQAGVEEPEAGEDGSLTYVFTPGIRDEITAEIRSSVLEYIEELNRGFLYPSIITLEHDASFSEFTFQIDRDLEQYGPAGEAARELLIMAAYHQVFTGIDRESIDVSVFVEEAGSGDPLDSMFYPEVLDRTPESYAREDAPVETEGFGPGDRVVVDTGPNNLNLRNGPEITYLIIDILTTGTVLEVTGVDGVWLEVITPDQKQGWVHGDYVALETGE